MFQRSRQRAIPAVAALIGLFVFSAPAQSGQSSTEAAKLPAYEPDANHSRDQVPDVYKWSLEPLYASVADWDAERERLGEEIPKLATYQGKLADPATLKDCLDLYFSSTPTWRDRPI
jgi:hypothetical protein